MESRSDEYRPLFGREITDKPLFGVSNTRDRVVNLLVGCITVLLFGVTLLSAFLAKTPPPHALYLFSSLRIDISFATNVYKSIPQSDIEPFQIMPPSIKLM
ncbi:transmembrane protein [Caerostris extrusa]|uniref:Transmembrane protein n=1 Tax=Caerostris extrusa TaxID=172846 RepID=A0AAV4U765_CAEEX|nr:transmembrane protein [Caerostris extrusa]